MIPHRPDDQRGAGPAEEPDDDAAAPRVLGPAPLESQEELDREGSEEPEADQVQFSEEGEPEVGRVELSVFAGDFDQEEHDGHKSAGR